MSLVYVVLRGADGVPAGVHPALPLRVHWKGSTSFDPEQPAGGQQRLDTGAIVDDGPGLLFWDAVDRTLRQRPSWVPPPKDRSPP